VEKELDHDIRKKSLGFMYVLSADIVKDGVAKACFDGFFPKGTTFAEQLVLPEKLPAWLTEKNVEFYVFELTASGFRGGMNYYRNFKALPEILGPHQGRKIN
jgi:hypothetical protein